MKNTYSNNKSIWKNKEVRTWESEVIRERCKILDIEYEDEEENGMQKKTQNQDALGSVAVVNGTKIYTTRQLAIIANATRTTVQQYIEKGWLPVIKAGTMNLIKEKDADKFCEDVALSKTVLDIENIAEFNNIKYYAIDELINAHKLNKEKVQELIDGGEVETDVIFDTKVVSKRNAKKLVLYASKEGATADKAKADKEIITEPITEMEKTKEKKEGIEE